MTTAADQGLLGARDEVHLERATALGMVLVTTDRDFLRLVGERTRRHPGVLFILPQTPVGTAVRAITLAAQLLDPADVESWIEWIS
jgi:hypothetical protein